jgi:hypothetical protein
MTIPITTFVGTFFNSVDTFTATGVGTTINATARPLKSFTIQVTGTGALPTLWTVALEGSLDNINWTPILSHIQSVGNGVMLSTGTTIVPVSYLRVNCTTLALGLATNIVVATLGVE